MFRAQRARKRAEHRRTQARRQVRPARVHQDLPDPGKGRDMWREARQTLNIGRTDGQTQ